MLEMILKLYSMAMAVGVRSPVPHLFGPPGCGKSSVVEQAANLIGVQLHIINVSRLSPLEVEGVQMPHGSDEDMVLRMLPATFWTQLKKGDIILFDEFLRGFPEVYNALLDIFTSRRAGAFILPEVFIIAASNTTVAYDKALEDRLLHLPVPDPRASNKEGKAAKKLLAQLVVDQLGLLPQMATSMEMQQMLDTEVLPMYKVLDNLVAKSSAPATIEGRSIRNLIGQAQLRLVQCDSLAELVKMNNVLAMQQGKAQYVFFLSGKDAIAHPKYQARAEQIKDSDKLTPLQRQNLELNLELIELEAIRNEKMKETADDAEFDDDIFN